MEPVTIAIIAAISSATNEAISDTYQALKRCLVSTFSGNSDVSDAIDKLEQQPESKGRQLTLDEELVNAKAIDDQAVVDRLKALVEQLKHSNEAQATLAKFNVSATTIGVVADHVDNVTQRF